MSTSEELKTVSLTLSDVHLPQTIHSPKAYITDMTPAICVENLSKRYRISHVGVPQNYRTVRESLTKFATWPMRRWKERSDPARKEDFWALRDVGFEVQKGEVVGIIGRNGAGKSTLLKILSRITGPSSGQITLHGRVGSLLEVGTGFHPELSGRENIYLNGCILGMSRKEIARRFDEIVDFAEVDGFLDTPVKRYSSGMHVRLAFAVAAYLNPEILIVDEVLAVGDMQFQRKCLGRIKNIGEQGRTVLFVSHSMAAVLGLCQRAIHISRGRIIDDSDVSAVVSRYSETLGTSSGGIVDLCNHASRDRGSEPLIQGVEFKNAQGEIAHTFACGQSIIINFHIKPSSHKILQPHLGIGFDNALGQRVFSVATYLSACTLPPLETACTVSCRIEELALPPGTYTLSLSAGAVGQPLMDALSNAVTIEVTPADFYGNGKLASPALGQVLVRSTWSMQRGQS